MTQHSDETQAQTTQRVMAEVDAAVEAEFETQAQTVEPRFPIPLNAEHERAVKLWAADDRLWTTEETVEFNLRTFARVILAALRAESYLQMETLIAEAGVLTMRQAAQLACFIGPVVEKAAIGYSANQHYAIARTLLQAEQSVETLKAEIERLKGQQEKPAGQPNGSIDVPAGESTT